MVAAKNITVDDLIGGQQRNEMHAKLREMDAAGEFLSPGRLCLSHERGALCSVLATMMSDVCGVWTRGLWPNTQLVRA
jgi:hypothetical protein